MFFKKRDIDMSNGPLFINMLSFALPIMAMNILQLLFNAADMIVVGRFSGSEALAAVGATGSLINLIVTLYGLVRHQCNCCRIMVPTDMRMLTALCIPPLQ